MHVVGTDVMAPIEESMELLKLLEDRPSQLTREQVSICFKATLLAIGAHIEHETTAWLRPFHFDQAGAWERVSTTTGHRMSGQRLQSTCLAIKQQREEQRKHPGQREEAVKEREEEAACVAAVQAMMHRRLSMQERSAGEKDCHLWPRSGMKPCVVILGLLISDVL